MVCITKATTPEHFLFSTLNVGGALMKHFEPRKLNLERPFEVCKVAPRLSSELLRATSTHILNRLTSFVADLCNALIPCSNVSA